VSNGERGKQKRLKLIQKRHSNRQQYSAKSLASEIAVMGTLPETKRKSQGG